jgi:hypothetical protein
MARSLRVLLLFAVAFTSVSVLSPSIPCANGAELDKKGKSDAKEAMRLYKEGNYEDAAKVFARLSVAYPDMLVFVRNLGACYYYLRRWEPAISNLRDYEHRKKDIAPDDQSEVAGWIGEMERLRDLSMVPQPATPQPPTVVATPPAPPVVAPEISPPAPVPVPLPSASAPPSAISPTAVSPVPAEGTATQPEANPRQYQSQPGYPPGPYGYPQSYPNAGYPPAGSYPQGYPAGSYPSPAPAGQVAAAPPPSHTGRKVAAWILGITGATSIVVGVACTAKAVDDFSKLKKKYDPAVEDEGRKLAAAQWVGYGVGGALLVAAIIVGTSGGSSSRGVALAPAVGPTSAGATLTGSF